MTTVSYFDISSSIAALALNVGPSPFTFLRFALVNNFGTETAVVTASSSTQIIVTNADVNVETTWEGTNLTFGPDGFPTGGTISSLTMRVDGDVMAVFTDIDLDATDIFDAILSATSDGYAALDALLGDAGVDFTLESTNDNSFFNFGQITGDVVFDNVPAGSSNRQSIILGQGDDDFTLGYTNGLYQIGLGDGQDIIRFSDLVNGRSRDIRISVGELASDGPLRVFIDETTDFARFITDNGATTFVNLFASFSQVGFSGQLLRIDGTENDDVFNIAATSSSGLGRVVIDSSAGDDIFRISLGTTLTLIFDRGEDFTDGVVVRLDRGLIVDDGYGGRDRVFVTDQGGSIGIVGSWGDDTLFGGDTDNTFNTMAGLNLVNGGGGSDWVIYSSSRIEELNVNLSQNRAIGIREESAMNDRLYNIENIRGGRGDDTIIGNGADNVLIGGQGSDILRGLHGNDTLSSNDNANTLFGGDGDDHLSVLESAGNLMNGGDGNDTLQVLDDGFGAGSNTLTGGAGDDLLEDNDADAVLNGGSGNDTVFGSVGNDTITGGAGDDRLFAGTYVENLHGASDDDDVSGGGGNDLISGGRGNDTLNGGSGRDTISGGGENDRLIGGGGNDSLSGGDAADVLIGGTGNDTMTGGNGADTFVFGGVFGSDVITDFDVGSDVLRLSSALVDGEMDTATIVSTYASVTGDPFGGGAQVVFDFGNGRIIVLEGVTSLTGLADDIDVF